MYDVHTKLVKHALVISYYGAKQLCSLSLIFFKLITIHSYLMTKIVIRINRKHSYAIQFSESLDTL